jgi:hypothetical protein
MKGSKTQRSEAQPPTAVGMSDWLSESSRGESSIRATTPRRTRPCATETDKPSARKLTDCTTPREPGVRVTCYVACDGESTGSKSAQEATRGGTEQARGGRLLSDNRPAQRPAPAGGLRRTCLDALNAMRRKDARQKTTTAGNAVNSCPLPRVALVLVRCSRWVGESIRYP